MAYTPTNWVCGDTITAEKLNKLENGLAECCGGGGDVGYSCSEEWVTLTEESVTTIQSGGNFSQGILTYSQLINADTIRVTFNGTEYECIRESSGDGYSAYGGFSQRHPDFTEYPFALYSEDANNEVYTESAGTYQVKIEALEETIETTECFKKAVRSISGTILTLAPGENGNVVKGATWQEAYDMLVNGAMVYLNDEGDLYPCSLYSDQVIAFSKTVITDVVYTDTYIWNPDSTVIYDSATYPSE